MHTIRVIRVICVLLNDCPDVPGACPKKSGIG